MEGRIIQTKAQVKKEQLNFDPDFVLYHEGDSGPLYKKCHNAYMM